MNTIDTTTFTTPIPAIAAPIHNIEELLRRWLHIDSKRPDTLSKRAVEMFYKALLNAYLKFEEAPEDGFEGERGDLLPRVLTFSINYKKAVQDGNCPLPELLWVMPYARYAQTLEHFIGYDDRTFPPESFEDWLQKAYSYRKSNWYFAQAIELTKKAEQNEFRDIEECQALCDSFDDLSKNCRSEQDEFWRLSVADSSYEDDYDPWNELPPEDQAGCFECGGYEDIYHIFGFSAFDLYWYDYDDKHRMFRDDHAGWTDWVTLLKIASTSQISKLLERHESKESGFKMTNFGIIVSAIQKYAPYYFTCKSVSAEMTDKNLTPKDRLKRIFSLCDSGKILSDKNELFIKKAAEDCFFDAVNTLGFSPDMERISENSVSQALDLLLQYSKILPEDIVKYYSALLKQQQEVSQIRSEERRQVLFEMSHSIKNLIATVSDPLTLLKDELTGPQQRVVERALDGTSLLRIMAFGIHMSMRGKPGEWRQDIVSTCDDGTALQSVFEQALRQSAVNMFHGKYFERFTQAYFEGDLNRYLAAKNAWDAADSWSTLAACLQEHFFDFEFTTDTGCAGIFLSDTVGAKTQLMLMLQELCLNAVKNAALVPRPQRKFHIHCSFDQSILTITMQNSAVSGPAEKSSGLGLIIIKNFAALFEADYQHGFADGIYTTALKIDFAKKEA